MKLVKDNRTGKTYFKGGDGTWKEIQMPAPTEAAAPAAAPEYPTGAVDIMPYRGPESVPTPDFSSPLARTMTGLVQGVSMGNAGVSEAVAGDPRFGPPEGFAEKAGDIFGTYVGGAFPLLGMMAAGVPAPAAFGAMGAAHPADSMVERGVNAAGGATVGALFHGMNPALAGLAGKMLGQEAVAPALQTLSQPAVRAGMMYLGDAQLRAAQGQPVQDAMVDAIPATAAMFAVPGEVYGRTPAVARGEVSATRAAQGRVADKPQTEMVRLAELTGKPAAGDEMVEVPVGFKDQYRAAQEAPMRGQGDPATQTPEFVDANYPPLRENAPLEMRRPDVAPQNVTDVTGRSGRMIPEDGVRVAAKGVERGPEGAAKGLEPTEWDAAVAAQPVGPLKHSDLVERMRGVATEPVTGVESTIPQSKFIKGEVDEVGYVAEYAARAGKLAGNITETHRTAGRHKVLVDKMAERLQRRVEDGEMSAEEAARRVEEYDANIAEKAKSGTLKPLKGRDEQRAMDEALRSALPKELVDEIDAARVRDFAVKESVDPRRFFQGAGGKKIHSVIDRFLVRQNEMAERTTEEFVNRGKQEADAIFGETVKRGSKDYKNIGEMVKLVKAGEDAAAVVAKPEFADVAAKFDNPTAALDAAVRIRALLERGSATEKQIHEVFGINEPGYQEGYWPSTEAPLAAADIGGRVRRFRAGLEGETTRRMDPKPVKKQFNPRHLRKTGSVQAEDMSGDVVYDWLVRHARTLGHTPAISNNDAIARYLEISKDFGGAEYKNLPTAIRAITGSKYGGQRFGLSGLEQQKAAASPAARASLEAAHFMKQAFNQSNYQFNPWFNMFTQWTSSFLGAARYPIEAPIAMLDTFNPKLRALHDESYAGWMKRQPGGRITREGAVEGFGGRRVKRVSEKLDKAGGFMSQVIEREAGIYSYALATRVGAQKGWSPKQVDAFASDMIARTQSMYDNYNRAELLKSISLNFLMPAQSYGVEVKNEVQNWFGGKYGIEGGSVPVGMRALAMYLGMYLGFEAYKDKLFGQSRFEFNKFGGLSDAIKGEKPVRFRDVKQAAEGATGLISLMPYASSMLGTDIGEGKMRLAQVYQDFGKAAEDIADANDLFAEGNDDEASAKMAMAYGRMARLFMRGGAQQYKMIGTENMVREGRIPEDERALGYIVGPYSTPTMAEERIRKRGEKRTKTKAMYPVRRGR